MNPENNTPEGTVPSQTTDTPRQPEATTNPAVTTPSTSATASVAAQTATTTPQMPSATQPVANPMSVNEPQKPVVNADNAFAAGVTASDVKRKKLLKLVIIAAVTIAVVAVVAVVAQTFLSGSKVLGDLIPDTHDGVSFQRPEAWVMSEGDGVVYYAEEGADVARINNGIVIDKQAIGIDVVSLDDDEKSQVTETLKKQFSEIGKASLVGDTCSEPGETSVEAVETDGYELAFRVIVQCNNIVNADEGGALNMLVGWRGTELQLFTVVATDSVATDEADTLQKIIDSVGPDSKE